MIALSGVRSSCDMFARNADLCWLAISSWWNSWAFCIASADWLAKVVSRSTTCCGNSPGWVRAIAKAPITWSSRISGTASRARKPLSMIKSRRRLS